MEKKYYNDIYFTLGQIDDVDTLSATLFTCMKMWTDKHDIDFLPWFLTFAKDGYNFETGRDLYKDIFSVGIDATLGKELQGLRDLLIAR